ncbi:hypothetical protein [Coralloluteibacterium thermophilus]|uniref:Uncharacterized protein n=1 Tax=Coralloluteibacterium thermophilum TaxID=2707049 RepID=A0ABV9NI83_9GAMM
MKRTAASVLALVAATACSPAAQAQAHGCRDCGTVTEVARSYDTQREGRGVRGAAGLFGALLGSLADGGHGIAGPGVVPVGTAVRGAQVREPRPRDAYHVTVRMDDGRYASFDQASGYGLRPGDRVEVLDREAMPLDPRDDGYHVGYTAYGTY